MQIGYDFKAPRQRFADLQCDILWWIGDNWTVIHSVCRIDTKKWLKIIYQIESNPFHLSSTQNSSGAREPEFSKHQFPNHQVKMRNIRSAQNK